MKRFSAVLLSLVLCAGVVFAGLVKFDAAKFTPEYTAKDILRPNCKVFKKLNVKKVAILECYGEYMQSKEVSASALEKTNWANDATNWVPLKSQVSTIDLGNDFYTFATDQVYDKIAKAFSDSGIEVIGKDIIAASPLYAKFDLEAESSGGGYTGGIAKQSVTTKTLKRSTSGLGLFSNNPFKLMGIIPKMGEMIKETGADAAVRVMFYVDKGKNGVPMITQFKMDFYGNVEAVTAGFKGHEKTSYYVKQGPDTIFMIDKGIESQSNIAGTEKGSVDIQKYNSAMQEIAGALTEAFKLNLTNTLTASK